MKAPTSVLAAACLLALAPALPASEPAAKPAATPATGTVAASGTASKAAPAKPVQRTKTDQPAEKTVVLTGSHIPQQVTKVGQITDGADPVVVVSQADLARTGAPDLATALRKSVPQIH